MRGDHKITFEKYCGLYRRHWLHNIKYYLGKDYLMRSKGVVRQSSGYGKYVLLEILMHATQTTGEC